MALNFATAGDELRLNSGGFDPLGAFSLAVLFKKNTDGVWHAIIQICTSAGATRMAIELTSGGAIELQSNGGTNTIVQRLGISVADGWVLVVCCKPAGTSIPVFHRYVYATDTWTHDSPAGTLPDPIAVGANGTIRFGQWSDTDDAKIDLEHAGWWNRALTTAEVEQLPFSVADWTATSPWDHVRFDHAQTTQKVTGFTGSGASEAGTNGVRVGTTVSSASVPIFNYGMQILESPAIGNAGGGATLKQADDTGVGTDTWSLVAAIPAPDTSGGIDASALAAALSAADNALGNDSFSVVVPGAPSFSDLGVGTDSFSVVVKVTVADVSTGTDTPTVQFSTTVTELGAGADVASATAKLTVPDSGAGLDAFGPPIVVVTAPDSVTSTDTVSVGTVSYAIADSALGVDAFSTITGRLLGETRAGRVVGGHPGRVASSRTGRVRRRLA